MIELFQHVETPALPAITEMEISGKRWYTTPGGCYPSMTTVLSAQDEGAGKLEAWRERVGEAEAERIRELSTGDGTDMHGQIEGFLRGWPIQVVRPRTRLLMRSILPLIVRIDNIRHLEAGLYSDLHRVAGRCDCIAEYEGELAVIDFKNSLKRKRREWIGKYFKQVAGYGQMYYELSGVRIKKGVILVAVAGESPQEFVIDLADHQPSFEKDCRDFHSALKVAA